MAHSSKPMSGGTSEAQSAPVADRTVAHLRGRPVSGAVIAWVGIWAASFLGIAAVSLSAWQAFGPSDDNTANSSAAMYTLLDTGRILEGEISRTVDPAIARTQMLAKSSDIIKTLASGDAVAQTALLNSKITSATEIDAIALFDSNGRITAINTRYADGQPIPKDRLDRVLGSDFSRIPIIRGCLRNNSNAPVLEFQTHCNITPAFFGSSGLSVAYSVPILNPRDGTKLGVISSRLRFERLSSLIQGPAIAGGAAKAFFITDSGGYFSEAINRGQEQPLVPVAELRDIVRPILSDAISKTIVKRGDKYLAIFSLPGIQTLEGGGIHILIVADSRWLTQNARQARLIRAAGTGLSGALFLIVAVLSLARLGTIRTRRKVDEAHARLAAIVESSAEAIISESVDGVIRSWNRGAETMLGFTAREIVGRTTDLTEPSGRAGEVAKLRAMALKGEAIEQFETQRRRKDGREIDVSISISLIRNSAGEIIGISRIARDITAQKAVERQLHETHDQLEARVRERTSELSDAVIALEQLMEDRAADQQALRDSEERFRQLAENTNDVFWMTSAAGDRILYISPRYQQVWGRSCEELYENAHAWLEAIAPDDQGQVLNAWKGMLAGGEFAVEYRIRRPDGTVRWIRDRALPIRDAEGKVYRIAGIAEDITVRRIGEQQLREAKEAAESANRAKSEFLARMSHEIRTPLNGVVGMIDLLDQTDLSQTQRRYADSAADAANALLSVINNILDFSKIEAGKLEVESIEFDLHKVVEDLIELFSPIAAKKDLALACFLRPEVPRLLWGDPMRIRQVLTNLISNAIKFTLRGSVGVRVTLESQTAGKCTIRIEVQDTGIGIPASCLDRLFKGFSQVDTSTTRKFGGTGLGLAISKQLVELMGGEIGVTSQEGGGTTFWMTLKVSVAEAKDNSNALEVLHATRLLAVEPDPRYLRILHEQFDARFSHFSVVANSGEALASLRSAARAQTPFDVVMAPHKATDTGLLTSAIKSDRDLRAIKLVAILDIDDRTEMEALRAAGFHGRVYRPLTQSRVLDTICSMTLRCGDYEPAAAKRVISPRPQANPLHLLVAEDNEMNQFVTQEILKRAGWTCEIVADGKSALEAVARNEFDAILMDCQMPIMGGLEAASRIREREAATPGARHIPIIALTADAVSGDREKCLAAGMDEYVSKPINAKELFAAVQRAMPSKRAAEPKTSAA